MGPQAFSIGKQTKSAKAWPAPGREVVQRRRAVTRGAANDIEQCESADRESGPLFAFTRPPVARRPFTPSS